MLILWNNLKTLYASTETEKIKGEKTQVTKIRNWIGHIPTDPTAIKKTREYYK